MSHIGPFFHAWCPDNERVAAYAAALSALLTPKWWSGPSTREELVEKARASFADAVSIDDGRSFQLLSEHVVNFELQAWRDSYQYGWDAGPILLQPEHQTEVLFLEMCIARTGIRSVKVEAAIFSIVTFENTMDLLRRVCAPDETYRVTTGACTWVGDWGSPLDACITYHADANVARDLALAWLNGYEETPTGRMAGWDLNALRARIVTATTTRAQVAQASIVGFSEPYSLTIPRSDGLNRGVEFPPTAAHELTREQVLAALELPGTKLLEALEAAATPDAEWLAVEPMVLEHLEAKKRGAPCDDVPVNTRPHLYFIEQHAPYHVRRLDNGAVMIGTHPYRTLWPLWANALDLLGIRSQTR